LHADGNQLLLGSVVQIALQPPAFFDRGRHQSLPAFVDLGQGSSQPEAEPADLDRQACHRRSELDPAQAAHRAGAGQDDADLRMGGSQ
jgi:hypothetical protein